MSLPQATAPNRDIMFNLTSKQKTKITKFRVSIIFSNFELRFNSLYSVYNPSVYNYLRKNTVFIKLC